jgi:hypothetical protein
MEYKFNFILLMYFKPNEMSSKKNSSCSESTQKAKIERAMAVSSSASYLTVIRKWQIKPREKN